MSHYDPLSKFLKSSKGGSISLAFAAIDPILGFRLPKSAKEHRPWWGNEFGPTSHSQCRAWLAAGFKVSEVDLVNQTVSFKRMV